MKKTLLISKVTFKLFWIQFLVFIVFCILLSSITNSFSCDTYSYTEGDLHSILICNDAIFHKYMYGLKTILFSILFTLTILPFTTALSIINNKLLKTNTSKHRAELCKTTYCLFGSLPIKFKDIVKGSYMLSFLSLLLILIILQSSNFIIALRTFNFNIISTNTLSISLLLGVVVLNLFLWLTFNNNKFSIFMHTLNLFNIGFIFAYILIIFTVNLLLSPNFNINYLKDNIFLTNLIAGNNLFLFIGSIVSSLLLSYLSFKSTLKNKFL